MRRSTLIKDEISAGLVCSADETSTTERKGGEYFNCSKCKEHFHADINAARNIIHVQDSSAVPGRTKDTCPTLSTLQ
ncbi:MAG: zinc ribbon domain-containing protein [Candidatus Thorarchaeota archaeon]